MKKIAIIGFGFCGKLALFHLIKSAKNIAITIFDEDGEEAMGPAFSSFSPHYILNVSVEKMSAFSDQPKDFYNFLEKKYPQILQEISKDGFAPRKIYGEYLQEITKQILIEAQQKNIAIKFIKSQATEVKKISTEDFMVIAKNNESCKANQILLATSFMQSELPFDFANKNFIKKLWDQNSLNFHHKNFIDEKICLIGSGLTAVDVIVGLKKKNFRGKIFVISRRGNFPQKHFLSNPILQPLIFVDDAKNGVLFICLKIRSFLKKNPQCDLRHVIDSMRSNTKDLWRNLDQKNKKLFLRLLPYWNIFRHRAPAFSIEIIEDMIKGGQLEIKKSGVKKITEKNYQFEIATQNKKIICDYVVNCLGFEFLAQKYPLLKQMIESNLLKKDLFLVKENHPQIHLLGGLNLSRDFECTAVPDLRINVENVVKNITKLIA